MIDTLANWRGGGAAAQVDVFELERRMFIFSQG